MSEVWRLLKCAPASAAWNMALDEALLDFARLTHSPLLRFYGWTEAAATFGYFQKFREVEAMTPLRPLIRRTTGGGLVPHDADWTYSLIIPPAHVWYQLRADESYQRLHTWLGAAFVKCGVTTDLAPCCAKELPGRCFAGPDKSDLMVENRKLAGAAQRRAKSGMLIQGSVQPPAGVVREDWHHALCDEATLRFGVTWQPMTLDETLQGTAESLVETKYATETYNQKR